MLLKAPARNCWKIDEQQLLERVILAGMVMDSSVKFLNKSWVKFIFLSLAYQREKHEMQKGQKIGERWAKLHWNSAKIALDDVFYCHFLWILQLPLNYLAVAFGVFLSYFFLLSFIFAVSFDSFATWTKCCKKPA